MLLSLELGDAIEPKRAVYEAAQRVYELGHVAGDDVVFFAETGKINKGPSNGSAEVHTLDKRSAAPRRAQLDSLLRLKRGMRRKENPATSKNDGVARKLTAPADSSIH